MAKPRSFFRMAMGFIAVLAVGAIAAFLARQAFLSAQFELVTYVDDSVGIAPSSPVLIHGIAIGHVRKVSLSGSKDPSRIVRIDMRFSREYLSQIPEDSTVAIVAANLLGDKSLDISRGVSSKPIAAGAEIHSKPTQDIGTVLKRGSEPLKTVDTIMARIDRIVKSVDNSDGSVGLLLNDRSLPPTLARMGRELDDLKASVKQGRGIAFRISEIRAEVKKPEARMNAVTRDFDTAMKQIQPLEKQASDATAEGRLIFAAASKDQRPAELMKQFRATGSKAEALVARAEKALDPAPLQKSLDDLSKESRSFSADLAKHPLSFFNLRFGLF